MFWAKGKHTGKQPIKEKLGSNSLRLWNQQRVDLSSPSTQNDLAMFYLPVLSVI
jgi:hypothetical protein